MSPRTVQNWVTKFGWSEDANKVDSTAQKVVLERATDERISLIKRVQRINDRILKRREETSPSPTLADFREGVKLESQLVSEEPQLPESEPKFEDDPFIRRIKQMTPVEMAEEFEKMARRIRRNEEDKTARQSSMTP